MSKSRKITNLPVVAFLAGCVCAIARGVLYTFCIDEKGLLPSAHPLETGMYLLAIAATGLFFVRAWKLDGSDRYEDNFLPSKKAAVGHFLFAVGIGLTMLSWKPMMQGYLGQAWRLLGLLSVPCLTAAGLARWKGKQPFFALHMIPCLFLVAHIINHYQTWSGDPQIHDYIFILFGTVALLLFAYYTAAFDVDHGSRRMHLATGLTALCLCTVVLFQREYLPLYAGGLLWVYSDLCSLTPKPREEEGEMADDPS